MYKLQKASYPESQPDLFILPDVIRARVLRSRGRRPALARSTIMRSGSGARGAGAGRRRAVVLHLRRILKYDLFSRSKASRSIETVFRMHLR